MRFWVRVPVLSTANTVVLPRLSTAAGQRASTPIRPRRTAPRARNSANTTGISLGSTARARARAARSASLQRPVVAPWINSNAVVPARAAVVRRAVSRRVCRCRRVSGGCTCLRLAPIRPNSVSAPVATTSAQPQPLATKAPAWIASPWRWRSTGKASPVSSDSSSHNPAASVMRASAATRSPSSRRSRSPHCT